MLEIRSALGATYQPGHHGGEAAAVTLRERLDLDLIQVAAWPDSRAALAAKITELTGLAAPLDGRSAVTAGEWALYQIAPGRYLVTAPRGEGLLERFSAAVPSTLGAVTELGHARSFLEIRGPAAREVLMRGFSLDTDPSVFPENAFGQTAVHHVGVLLHRLPGEADAFRILVLRTFARSFWEWLFETAEVFGCEVLEARR
jgi:heterotetrameric sarcosine oxidase gamma subunit